MTLTVKSIEALRSPGSYADGGGLYLQIASGGSKNWIYRYQVKGRRRELGLGGVADTSLAHAREKAAEARKQVREGIDPIDQRRAERAQAALAKAKTTSFEEAADAYIAAHQGSWRNPKHRAQWPATLETYAYPHFGAVAVAAVDVDLVLKAVEPIWNIRPETASRLRGRIEAVLDWSKARGMRSGENPARWRGHLDQILPKVNKAKAAARLTTGRGEHHAALDYREIGSFMAALREQPGMAARALDFAILTAARTGEVIGARWAEVNLAERTWTIPAERMKGGKEHRVPLSDDAMTVLDEMRKIAVGDFIFAANGATAISNMAMLMVLRRMKRDNITVHGFRSAFSDWCAERTAFPAEVREMALAHAVGDKVEAAYRRGDLFEKRRQLAEAWAEFCGTVEPEGAVVVPLRS